MMRKRLDIVVRQRLSWVIPLVAALAVAAGCRGERVTMEQLETAAAKVLMEMPERAASLPPDAAGRLVDVEKPDLKLGFIKLTDCAPLVIAAEKGFFRDEGLEVQLESQSNWKVLLDRVIAGQLDGAHMLAGQPIGAKVGFGTRADIITAFSLDYNGNAITLSNSVWRQMREADPKLAGPHPAHPITADALRPIVDSRNAAGDPLRMATVFPVSTHNYELRYWLAAAGIHPGMYTAGDVNGTTQAEVLLSVTPPPQMPSTLEAGTIDGYCVGEPWNQKAVAAGIGVTAVTNSQIWFNNPEKVFGVSRQWHDRHPNTHIALVKALIRAGQWLDETDTRGRFVNRVEASRILSQPQYVGADYEIIAASMTGSYTFQPGDTREMAEFNVFFKDFASYPHYSDCVWFLTQMRRWGQINEPMLGSWYAQTAEEIYQPEIYRQAAAMLIAEGRLDAADVPPPEYAGYRLPTERFIDGKTYDGTDPLGYLSQFEIGHRN